MSLDIFGVEKSPNPLFQFLEVPWEVTTSYLSGTSRGPEAIFRASWQVDLFDSEVPGVIEAGMEYVRAPDWVAKENDRLKPLARSIIKSREAGLEITEAQSEDLKGINAASEKLQNFVFEQCFKSIKSAKVFGVLGGDHSVPLGAIQAFSQLLNGNLGVLHFDAHHDLRESYQGFTQSHASIMRNVMNSVLPPKKLVQVGIRDFSEEEYLFAKKHPAITTFYDRALKAAQYAGESWSALCKEIIAALPKEVYISFDIDGLNPIYCPNTGTPVPGGLDFSEVRHLLIELAKSGRKIVGFDLVEVAPGASSEYDGNVAARLLYSLCAATVASRTPATVKDIPKWT